MAQIINAQKVFSDMSDPNASIPQHLARVRAFQDVEAWSHYQDVLATLSSSNLYIGWDGLKSKLIPPDQEITAEFRELADMVANAISKSLMLQAIPVRKPQKQKISF